MPLKLLKVFQQLVLSSKKQGLLKQVSEIISQEKFRTYFNNDIIGTQIGGAMKNVIAIACGIIIEVDLGIMRVQR